MSKFEAVSKIIREILEKPDLEIGMDAGVNITDGWDSIATVNILSALMMEFDLEVGLDDFEKFSSIKGIMSVLGDKT